jgi:hypothetical protein
MLDLERQIIDAISRFYLEDPYAFEFSFAIFPGEMTTEKLIDCLREIDDDWGFPAPTVTIIKSLSREAMNRLTAMMQDSAALAASLRLLVAANETMHAERES